MHDEPAPHPVAPAAATALVLGLGESGRAMARWLDRSGWTVRLADTRADPPQRAALLAELPQAQWPAGPVTAALLEGVQLLALSPGLSPHHEPVAALLQAAAARGIDVAGEIELFARALQRLQADRGYAPRVIGVTGTNGKTTTVRMAAHMVACAGRSVCAAGNISPSALDALRAALDADRLPEYWVLELSSFQLASTRSLRCTAAAVLNVTQDHLDWHAGFDDYRASKLRIFAPGTARIFNRDDAQTVPAAAAPDADGTPADTSFGADAPRRPGEFGLLAEGGLTWLACTDAAPPARRRRRAARVLPSPVPATDGSDDDASAMVHRLMPADALPVRGRHNALNALAALALVRAAALPLAPALRALASFVGEDHRTQTVAQVAGVEYIDDSKGTNVGATVAALEGLAGAAGPRRILVILGGDGKGQSFAPLAPAVQAHAKAALLIGRDAAQIAQALQGVDVPVLFPADLDAAVKAAAGMAQAGDLVLLSPACASFDAFRNYAHRAAVFRAAVADLTPRAAVPEGR